MKKGFLVANSIPNNPSGDLPRSGRGHPLSKGVKGYTLIEILIVLFIVSIVTTVALLTIHRNENKEMETFANDLTQMLSLATEQALLEPRVLGLSISEHSVQFAGLQHNERENKQVWQPLQDNLLGQRKIPSHMHLGVKAAEEKLAINPSKELINPQIIISTNGDITPFIIYVGKKGQKPRYAIIGDSTGHVTSKQLS